MKLLWVAITFFVVAGFGLSFFYYPYLPEKIPSHWNAAGKIDAYLPKEIALFIMPLSSLFVALLVYALPKIDPLRKNYSYFMPCLGGFFLILAAFFLYIHVLTITAGLGVRLEMNYLLLPAVSALFFYTALLLRKARRNWFVGIRTPWTLSSEKVWDKTHRFGSYCFAVLGVIFLVLLFVPARAVFPLLIFSVLFLAFLPVTYSYFLWKAEVGKKPS